MHHWGARPAPGRVQATVWEQDAEGGPVQGAWGRHLGQRRGAAEDAPRSEEDVGGPEPQGDDLVGVGTHGDAEGAREAKVGQLELALAVDEEVLGLQVSAAGGKSAQGA